MAQLVEDLITTVAQKVMGTLQVGGRPASEDGTIPALPPIDLTGPWPRKPYRELVKAAAGEDWFTISAEQRRERCGQLAVEISPAMEDFEITNQVFEKLVEAKSRNPLFVTHLPKDLLPLPKPN